MTIDEYIDGFYKNDFSDKTQLKTYTEQKVMAFEMRTELSSIIKKYPSIKTGFIYNKFDKTKEYVIYFKK